MIGRQVIYSGKLAERGYRLVKAPLHKAGLAWFGYILQRNITLT